MPTARKQLITILALAMLIIAGVAAVKPPKGPFKNLKILPQDISEEKLDSIMHSYNKALGVKCGFCHVPMQGVTDSLDYASDAEPMKNNARDMMRMTIYINQTYFNFPKGEQPVYMKSVNCMTCHRGEEMPDDPKPIKHK